MYHMKNLNEVLSRLEKHGFRLKQEKCAFLAHSVEYLEHRIDKEGISALPRKVEAIASQQEEGVDNRLQRSPFRQPKTN